MIKEPKQCSVSVPGGCGINWISNHSFGYLTIPEITLTAFLLLIGFLVLASTGESGAPATLPADAER